jgi:hypothetical protein
VKHVAQLAVTVIFLVSVSSISVNYAHADSKTNLVPQWVRQNALWWSQGEISDSDFINGMKWLVENRIIPVEDLTESVDSLGMPDSVKKIAYSWAQGSVPDAEFIRGIEYLIKNGVIELDDNFVSKVIQERLDQVSVRGETKKFVVIIPVFTAAAYTENKFYSYYGGQCGTQCLTSIIYTQIPLGFTASGKATSILESLGYYTLTDIDVDKNPSVLLQYDKVIILHNEYVTQREFDAITTHPHVVYLYPNALYGKIVTNYDFNTMTLVRGHGYPDLKIRNGFDWKFDNSQFEYDIQCTDWKFYNVTNGIMLDCYPENHLASNIPLLQAIKDY